MSDLLTFAAVLDGHNRIRRDRAAITLLQPKQADVVLTYGRLIDGAAGFAARLAAAGVGQGQVVVIILPHGELLVDAFWGASLHGAIPSILPPLTEKLSPEKYRRDLAALIGVTQPGAIVTDPGYAAEAQQAVAQSGHNVAVITLHEPTYVTADFKTLGGARGRIDDIALLQHSSGTTGLQKGVALSHRAVFQQLQAYAPAIHLSPNDVIVSWLPLYHDMGLIASFVMPVLRRVPVVMMSPFDWVRAPARLLQAISAHKGTLCWLPNFAYNFSATRIRERDLEGVDLSSMRAFINCSEPCYKHSHAVFARKFAKYGLRSEALHTCYAMAENTFAVTQSTAAPAFADSGAAVGADSAAELHLSCGRPLPNTRLRVLGEDGAPLPEGQTGEIVVQSDCMLSGYYHRDELTAQAFVDGYYRTGDLGHLSGGELFVTGRKKDLIIVGGKNVYPNDLEQLASEVAGVHAGRVAAFGVFDQEAGTEEVVVMAESDAATDDERERVADDVRAHITKNSDVAVRIVRIVPARWLIKTSSGKVARSANRDKYLAEE